MDESLQELEAELKSLQPRRPSAQWSARVGRELAVAPFRTQYTSATNLSSWKWFGWRTAVDAAAGALVTPLGFLISKPVHPASVTTPPVVASANPAPASRDHYPPATAT